MLIQIPDVLTPGQVEWTRRQLAAAGWVGGRVTAGYQSAGAKDNEQLPEEHPVARGLGEMIVRALQVNPLFISAALPARVFPPLFSRYEGGHAIGNHVDNAIRESRFGMHVRTDVSCTLFLSDPDDYDGGDLLVENTDGVHAVKLPAGHLMLYPSTSLHNVRPVTRGVRMASFFWIQSMVRDDGRRALLFDLDTAIQRLTLELPDHPSAVQLTGVYHNLLRQWAEV